MNKQNWIYNIINILFVLSIVVLYLLKVDDVVRFFVAGIGFLFASYGREFIVDRIVKP
jgi:uncharacterized membrane protein